MTNIVYDFLVYFGDKSWCENLKKFKVILLKKLRNKEFPDIYAYQFLKIALNGITKWVDEQCKKH